MDISEQNIYFLISRILSDFETIKKDYTKRLLEDGYGVTAPQLEIMKAIGENPDLSLGELATLTTLHITTVEGYTNRLAKKGYVKKMKDRDDARKVLVSLSVLGEQVLKTVPLGSSLKLFEELKKLTLAEKKEIYKILKKLALLMR